MKFSVTIPAFKANYLKECIESILSQTYKDFELIIVNDASPEDLTSVVNSFNDPRIRYYINETNCGALNVVDNWNKCLAYATGEYIICMGDDDKLLPNCLEEYVKLIIKYPKLGVYHAWTEIIDENSKVIAMQEPRPLREGVYSMILGRCFGRIQFIGDFLFDRKLLLNNGGFYKLPLAWSSDDISAYIAAKDTGIANMQIPGFQYRISSQTITNTKTNAIEKLKAIIKEESWYEKFLLYPPCENNAIEYVFWKMALEKLPQLLKVKREIAIKQDLETKGMVRALFYVFHKKEYHINMQTILKAIVRTNL